MGNSLVFASRRFDRNPIQKFFDLNWVVVLAVMAIATIGGAMLYSVAGGQMDPWASRHMMRFGIGLILMLAIAVTDLRVWMALAYPAYFAGLIMLLLVEIIGVTGMGGQRWLDLGVMRVQPSEFMKIALIMGLARYYHSLSNHDLAKMRSLVVPLVMAAVPVILVVRQPDLGTAILLLAGSVGLMFIAGARMWVFVTGIVAALAAIPVAWRFLLRDYQQDRVRTFLNPENDPLGAGYQILQSKIALGSGGVWGKGFLKGTQSHLNFLPEMKTDFIFTVLAEEFGLIGGLVLIALYLFIIGYGFLVAISSRNHFGRLLALGLVWTIFLYVFINIAMVMGLLPVVGVPLPLVSYGGSAMLTISIALGLVLSVALHRSLPLPRRDPFG